MQVSCLRCDIAHAVLLIAYLFVCLSECSALTCNSPAVATQAPKPSWQCVLRDSANAAGLWCV